MAQAITKQSERNKTLIFIILRQLLGLILIFKGIVFIRDTTQLSSLIQQTEIGVFSNNSVALAYVVTTLNLIGGVFIILGLFTRAMAIIQIPIIIVAAFFVNMKSDYLTGELILSLITLVLLVIFAIRGSDKMSVDRYFKSVFGKGSHGNTEVHKLEQ